MTDSFLQQAGDATPDSSAQAPDFMSAEEPIVDVEATWWGFKIVFNQLAAKAVAEVLDQVESKLKKHLKNPEVRAAICAILKIKSFRIGNVADRTGNGAKLVSPWLMPFSLVVLGEKEQNQSLWSTVWNPDATTNAERWSVDTEFNHTLSFCGPALAQHGDKLYCVHRGSSDDQSLWWCVYKPKNNTDDADENNGGWGSDNKFPGHKSATPPALVEFNGTLYCFHRGASMGTDDRNLWMCQLTADGTTWMADVKVGDGYFSSSGFAAAVFNGMIHLVYEGGTGSDSDHKIRHVSWDGHTWSQVTTLSGEHYTCDVPGLAVYRNQLHMVHRGWKDEYLYHCSSSDGVNWSAEQRVHDYKSTQGPALAVYNDLLYMVHRSSAGSVHPDLWWTTYNGSEWSADVVFNDHKTADNPALAVYTDPLATVNAELTDPSAVPESVVPQLICVHRGA